VISRINQENWDEKSLLILDNAFGIGIEILFVADSGTFPNRLAKSFPSIAII
jgi:hypothetical protein